MTLKQSVSLSNIVTYQSPFDPELDKVYHLLQVRGVLTVSTTVVLLILKRAEVNLCNVCHDMLVVSF